MSGSPSVHELSPAPEVSRALRACLDLPNVILFDSARRDAELGRYSFLSADPVETFTQTNAELGDDPFASLRVEIRKLHEPTLPGLPPFQGGAAGLLSYELGHCWERLPDCPVDEFRIPALTVGLYDWVIAWDHLQDRCWIIARNRREISSRERIRDLLLRLDEIGGEIHGDREPHQLNRGKGNTPAFTSGGVNPDSGDRRAEIQTSCHPAPQQINLVSNFTRENYIDTVGRVVEYIRAGDIFQANLSQRLLYPALEPAIDTYLRLREVNAAPFGGYFAHDDWSVLSASPERFLQLRGDIIETRPIKGTRRRRPDSEVELYTRDALRESIKDAAENVMIVDLLRNDLSRVCRPGSITVPKLRQLETYATVHHLVSEVRGQLHPDRDFWDAIAATFPGGSITGAPKVRAMEIISELERVSRGPYCGSLFYLGFDETADSNILIRTFTRRHGWLQCSVGGGIVAQSDPQAEYAETLHKAEGMLRALMPIESQRNPD